MSLGLHGFVKLSSYKPPLSTIAPLMILPPGTVLPSSATFKSYFDGPPSLLSIVMLLKKFSPKCVANRKCQFPKKKSPRRLLNHPWCSTVQFWLTCFFGSKGAGKWKFIKLAQLGHPCPICGVVMGHTHTLAFSRGKHYQSRATSGKHASCVILEGVNMRLASNILINESSARGNMPAISITAS